MPARMTESKDRHCTDVPFLLAYIAAWVVLVIIFSVAGREGANPQRILRGVDYADRICGLDAGVEDKHFAAWPYPPEYQFKVCVASCSETQTNTTLFPEDYASVEFVFYCIPVINGSVNINVTLSGDFENASEDASRAVADMYIAKLIILLSAGLALFGSYMYVFLNRYIAGLLVYLGILLTALGGIALSYAMFQRYQKYDDTEVSNRKRVVLAFGIITAGSTALFLLVVCALWTRIKIAIEVAKEAGRAIDDMKCIVCFPIIPFFIGGGYVVFWIALAMYIFSVSNKIQRPTPTFRGLNNTFGANYTDREWDQEYQRAFAFHFFHFLWTVQLFIYFTFMVTAGAVAEWYFTPYQDGRKPRGEGPDLLTNYPVRNSVYRTLRFHLGTLALGALIIAIIQFIRAMVHYMEEKAKLGKENPVKKAVLCCIKCCLWCAECCLDKINKNAFVWTAIWGDAFGTAACSAFSLIWRNLLRVAAVDLVGEYLMLLGKVLVAICTTGICALIFISYPYYTENMSSIIMPCVVIFIVSFFIASLFMVVFETTMDTTFFCFLVDEEHNKGAGKMLAAPGLIQLVDKFAEESRQEHNRQKSLRNLPEVGADGQPIAPPASAK